MDEAEFGQGPEIMGIPFTAVKFKGKLYAETLEGSICVRAEDAALQILSPVGEVLAEPAGEKNGGQVRFVLDGLVPGIQYRLMIKNETCV